MVNTHLVEEKTQIVGLTQNVGLLVLPVKCQIPKKEMLANKKEKPKKMIHNRVKVKNRL
jgi:hypothetical protein